MLGFLLVYQEEEVVVDVVEMAVHSVVLFEVHALPLDLQLEVVVVVVVVEVEVEEVAVSQPHPHRAQSPAGLTPFPRRAHSGASMLDIVGVEVEEEVVVGCSIFASRAISKSPAPRPPLAVTLGI